jgi:hypothetical protein
MRNFFQNICQLVKSKALGGAQGSQVKENVSQIKSGWHYRPRGINRQPATADSGAFPGTYGSAATNKDHDVWFNFGELDPKLQDATTRAPFPDHAQPAPKYD